MNTKYFYTTSFTGKTYIRQNPITGLQIFNMKNRTFEKGTLNNESHQIFFDTIDMYSLIEITEQEFINDVFLDLI